jgi:chromosome segregation protein
MPFRLKSLELNGYKTFASRVSFEFSDTITAVVGPNGSGKSNIADAIRWVLGEQSYRLLRGRRTDDMIFSGSDTRPRAGMASASIVFDNSEGWLPIDYSEVSITRRAYRDGQNEYLINNQKVRLRDVSELLSKSGLSERTYTVIGQGLVDAVLSLRAEERRKLFEEAAGIGLYRGRREHALRRLDATKRNLERVQDILSELEPRLKSLKRHAERSQKHEQIKTDLRELLREWYGYHWHRAQTELKNARAIAQLQEKHLEETRFEQENFSQQLLASRGRIHNLREQVNASRRKLTELLSDREATSRELAVVEERRRALDDRIQSIIGEKARLGEDIDLQKERLHEITEEVAQLNEDVERAKELAHVGREKFENRKELLRAAEETVQDSQKTITGLRMRQIELASKKSELETRLRKHQEMKNDFVDDLAKTAQDKQIAEEKLTQIEREREQAETHLQQGTRNLNDLVGTLNELDRTQKRIIDSYNSLNVEFERMQTRLKIEEQVEETMIGFASGTKLLLEAAQEDRMKGTRGALSQFIEVPSSLEVAISAALGDFADAVLIEPDADPDDALDLIVKEGVKAALLPYEQLKPLPALSPPISEGCLGLARNLIEVPPDLEAAAELLLGRVLIVRDRNTAKRLLSEHDQYSSAVTLVGEVFHNTGVIKVDSKGPNRKIGRHRNNKELTEAVRKASAQLERISNKLSEFSETENSLVTEKNQKEEIIRTASNELERTRTVYQKVALEFENARRQHEWQRKHWEENNQEITEIVEEMKGVSVESRQVSDSIVQANEETTERTKDLSELYLDEELVRLSQWETQKAVSDRALKDALNRQEEQIQIISKLRSSSTSSENLFRELEYRKEELESYLVVLQNSEKTMNGEIMEIRSVIEPTIESLRLAESEQENLQAKEMGGRNELTKAERYHTQSQIALARKLEALDTLRGRIEDDFGLVAFEYEETISGPTPLPFDGLVEHLPMVKELSPEVDTMLMRQRAQLRRIGSINPEAQEEYREVSERYGFLTSQVSDLQDAENDILEVIGELDHLMEREFRKTFDVVAGEFRETFTRLFGGGSGRLVLTEDDDLTNTGIDIETRLPGKKMQGLASLSGGERSLTAAALVFSLLKASPTPFAVLDEVDAMLDEANVGRFCELLRELGENTQFVVITHNRATVQAADTIYGITMGRDTTSQIISLKMDEVDERYSY